MDYCFYDIFIKLPKKFIAYIIPKGSITVDGVSLTVNEVFDDSFRLTIIPHTMKETLIRNYKKSYKVNVETDMFARYVAHIINHQNKSSNLSWDEVDSISARY